MITTKNLLPTKTTGAPLKPEIQTLAIEQVKTDLTDTSRGNSAITDIGDNTVIGGMKIPKKIRIKISNANSSGSTDISFLNNADYAALPANVTVTYSDGFGGKYLTRLMNAAGSGNGLLTYGFNVTGYDADNAKSDSVINGLEMEYRSYTGKGTSFLPDPIELAGEERNTAVQSGMLTVKSMILLNQVCQLKVNLAAGTSVEFVFSTVPIK